MSYTCGLRVQLFFWAYCISSRAIGGTCCCRFLFVGQGYWVTSILSLCNNVFLFILLSVFISFLSLGLCLMTKNVTVDTLITEASSRLIYTLAHHTSGVLDLNGQIWHWVVKYFPILIVVRGIAICYIPDCWHTKSPTLLFKSLGIRKQLYSTLIMIME